MRKEVRGVQRDEAHVVALDLETARACPLLDVGDGLRTTQIVLVDLERHHLEQRAIVLRRERRGLASLVDAGDGGLQIRGLLGDLRSRRGRRWRGLADRWRRRRSLRTFGIGSSGTSMVTGGAIAFEAGTTGLSICGGRRSIMPGWPCRLGSKARNGACSVRRMSSGRFAARKARNEPKPAQLVPIVRS